jgi:hypothetical protein
MGQRQRSALEKVERRLMPVLVVQAMPEMTDMA